MRSIVHFPCLLLVLLVTLCSCAQAKKFRVCVVEGRGGFKTAGKYCPTLDRANSKVECVIGVDRMDCLRRISKGKADFTVLTAEDLISALNSRVEVIVTNELRYSNQSYEYEVVAVVSKFAEINHIYDLQGKRLCHPGYGITSDWTNVVANFFEASVATQSCEPDLTLLENRIKSTSKFFQAACKAGPWVSNPTLDNQLKSKYPNLCELCDSPGMCSKSDKFWGRLGPLYCLTDGAGDVTWARLDDVRSHFSKKPGVGEEGANKENFNFICRDGTIMPLTAKNPCVWVAKPWQVIAAQRNSAPEVQKFIQSLSHDEQTSWEHALLNLIETYHFDITTVEPVMSTETYLLKVPGFLSANSFSGCHPPRSIRLCTTSIIETAKCTWLTEAAAVYGIEPDVSCIKANDKMQCLQYIAQNVADIAIVHPDLQTTAIRDYKLKTLFYANTKPDDLYLTVAVVKTTSAIKRFEDLRGHRACFPSYEGVAWNTVADVLHSEKLTEHECSTTEAMGTFFSESCVPGITEGGPSSLQKLCSHKLYDGDKGAFRCLAEGKGDVAFIDLNTIKNYTDGMSGFKWAEDLKSKDFRILCAGDTKNCSLSWATPAQAMVRANISLTQQHEIYDSFMQMDKYFGKYITSITHPFTLFAPYDGQPDVLFLDKTDKLTGILKTNIKHKLPHHYNYVMKNKTICQKSNSSSISAFHLFPLSVLVCLITYYFK